ncbi:MAG: tetratricopeptide repeat protein [Gemmatimonadota bacterium]
MRQRHRLFHVALPATLAAAGLSLLPLAHATAQEEAAVECQLEGSAGAQTASERLTEGREAPTPEAARVAYQAAYDAVKDQAGNDPTAMFLAANAAIGLSNYEQADGLLDRFVQLKPVCAQEATNARYNGWVTLYNEAIAAYQGGDLETALGRFQVANEFHPDLRAFNNTALLYVEMGDTENAIATYRAALQSEAEADPEQSGQIINGLGDLLLSEDRAAEAVEAYATYLEAHPDDVSVRIRYALALTEAGQTAEAEQIFQDILGRPDLTAEQWVEVGVGLYNSNNYAGAADAFAKARTENPYNKEAMENYVNAAVQADRAAEVLPLADTLVAWYPYDAANYQLLASAHARAKDNRRAMEVLQLGESSEVVFELVQMGQSTSGGNEYVVRGRVAAKGAAAGTQLQIPFEFLGADGSVVATETLTLAAPAEGESERFELSVTSATPIAGFRYKKSGGA